MQSVLVILYPGCIFFEIALATELIASKYQIQFITPDGSEHRASNGSIIAAHASYSTVDLSECRAILIPGGDPGSVLDNPNVEKMLKVANSRGLWLAAICAGPLLLAKAGVLKGRKIAHGYDPDQIAYLKSYFKEVQLTEEKFVCDANIITAKPDSHIDFAVEIACRLASVDASRSNRTKDYYRGVLGQKIRSLALALIRNERGQFLFLRGQDKSKGETFYRPLGGGIEFYESGLMAVEREIMEELNQKVAVSPLIASFENIFTYEGQQGHEIIMLYPAEFQDTTAYRQSEFEILESGRVVGKAVWRSVKEICAEGSKLYPIGLENVIMQ